MKNLSYKILIFCFIILILFFMTVSPVSGENDERTIIVRQGETIRELADKYLGDPNLWIEILKKK